MKISSMPLQSMVLTLHLKPTLLGGLDSLEYRPCGAGSGVQTALADPVKAQHIPHFSLKKVKYQVLGD